MAGKDILIGHFNYLAKDGGVFIYVLRKQRQSTLKKPPKIRRALKKSFQRITD
jgi:hypothetical protein